MWRGSFKLILVALNVLFQCLHDFSVNAVVIGLREKAQIISQRLFHSNRKDRFSQLRCP
jgi:hypothetical protein